MPNSLTQTELLAIVTGGVVLAAVASVVIDTGLRVGRRLGLLP
jgi:hypothetical protein